MADNSGLKRTFEVDGKEYAVYKPNAAQSENGSLEYARVFSKAVKSGALLRETVEGHMREQGIWDNDKDIKYVTLLDSINKADKSLQRGGIKLSEAKEIAVKMRMDRGELQNLIGEKNSLDANTAQGQGETARFNYLLVECLVYNDTGKSVYKDRDAYLRDDDSEVSQRSAAIFANMWYGLEEDYDKTLPENQFLKQWGVFDDELRLLNDDGELIDTYGRRVNEDGRFIDESGNFIDVEGDPLTEDGEYDFGKAVFFDDTGKPLGESEQSHEDEKTAEDTGEENKAEEKDKPKKRGRPKKSETKTE
jgi:hypothetical protein